VAIEPREQVIEQRFDSIEMGNHAPRLVVEQALHVGQRKLAMKPQHRLKKIVRTRGAVA
jgi:hypothetical protein